MDMMMLSNDKFSISATREDTDSFWKVDVFFKKDRRFLERLLLTTREIFEHLKTISFDEDCDFKGFEF